MSFHQGAPTSHNAAMLGDFARTVLMLEDPLGAKFIVENYLTDPVCANQVRRILGYTGLYKGQNISVMGSGMGIYFYELFVFYGVENIARNGSAGVASQDIKVMDVIVAASTYSDSSCPKEQKRFDGNCIPASKELSDIIIKRPPIPT